MIYGENLHIFLTVQEEEEEVLFMRQKQENLLKEIMEHGINVLTTGNWINNGDDGQGNTKRDCYTDRIYQNKKVNHNCDNISPTTSGHPLGWGGVLGQFDDVLPLPEQKNNAKLILRGYSWGGGLVTMIAAAQRCHALGCDVDLTSVTTPDTPLIDSSIPNFDDTTIDFVWLIDPVGPNGLRRTLTDTNGYSQNVECCAKDPGTDQKFSSRVSKVLVHFQNSDNSITPASGVPSDKDTIPGFLERSSKIEQWYAGNSNSEWKKKGLKFDNQVCNTDDERKYCHEKIVEDKT